MGSDGSNVMNLSNCDGVESCLIPFCGRLCGKSENGTSIIGECGPCPWGWKVLSYFILAYVSLVIALSKNFCTFWDLEMMNSCFLYSRQIMKRILTFSNLFKALLEYENGSKLAWRWNSTHFFYIITNYFDNIIQ